MSETVEKGIDERFFLKSASLSLYICSTKRVNLLFRVSAKKEKSKSVY